MPLFCCGSSSVAVSPTLIMPSSPQTRTKPESSSSPHTPNGSRSEMKVNDLVGKEFSGSLQKWVNYGKGWRRRWFVLQDGVLSYYKIHGTDKNEIDAESRKGSKVTGEESRRRLLHKQRNGLVVVGGKALGQVHLKVSTIRESRSDDKRFSIYTGTKMLHLRAETREDRNMWIEALKAVKEMFPKKSNSELIIPFDEFVVSTKNLRQRLMEEGVNEAVIQDCERIVRSEFAPWQTQLALLKHKHALLIDTLRHLETEKVDLENTVIDESQRQASHDCSSSKSRTDKCSGSTSEMEDDNDRNDAGDEESDEEDNMYFDTHDFLSSESLKSSSADAYRSDIDSDDEEQLSISSVDGSDSPTKIHTRFNYPYVKKGARNYPIQLKMKKE